MRPAFRLLVPLAALVAFLASACGNADLPAGDVCQQATNVFLKCGVTLPLLTDGPCTGTKRALAGCVAHHAANCEELAGLEGHIDACVADELDGGDSFLPPAEDLPLPAFDAGHDGSHAAPTRDAGALADANAAMNVDGDAGALAAPDSASDAPLGVDAHLDAPEDAGPLNAVWSGLSASGTVTRDQEVRFTLPSVPPGTHTFTMSGTGDADLYVKEHTKPTTTSFDCRPFLQGSSETCTVTLATEETLFVMVRGAVATSTYTLEGR